MIFIRSKFFIRPIVLYWTVGLLVVGDIFFSKYIPHNNRHAVEIILTLIYILLFLWTTFYLLFKSLSKWETENEIEELEEERKESPRRFETFGKENLLLYYKTVQEKFSHNTRFIHILKKKEKLTDKSNIGNYFIILLIFFSSQFSYDYLKPIGSIIFISLASVCILFCIRIIVWEGFGRKNFISPIIIGHALCIYLLFSWGKNSYIRGYGNEVIGSYFEKPEYRTRYYVNIAPVDERNILEKPKTYLHLQAEIYVFSEAEEGETSDGYFTSEHTSSNLSKYIIVEKVFSANGGALTFSDCQAEIGEKLLCRDTSGNLWHIELTKEKVK